MILTELSRTIIHITNEPFPALLSYGRIINNDKKILDRNTILHPDCPIGRKKNLTSPIIRNKHENQGIEDYTSAFI